MGELQRFFSDRDSKRDEGTNDSLRDYLSQRTERYQQYLQKPKEEQKQNSQFPFQYPTMPKTISPEELPEDSPYRIQSDPKHWPNQGTSKVENGNGLPYFQGTILSAKKPGMVTTPIPKEKREGATLESGVKSAMFGVAEGVVGKEGIVRFQNAGLELLGHEGDVTVEDYEKYKREQITGNANNELSGTENVIDFVGQIGGNAASYIGANKLVSALGKTGAAVKAGTLLKNTKPAKVLSGTKFGKSAGKVLTNPHIKNLLAGQVADTVVQTPRVISEGVSEGKSAGQIAGDVAKQQASDLAWNVGFEAVGAIPDAIQGAKKLVGNLQDARTQKAITEDSVRSIFESVPGQEVKNGIFLTDGLSDSTITAVRKIQTIADTAGKDFSEIASAVRQGKTMKELLPEIENLARWAKKWIRPDTSNALILMIWDESV